jgi:uncharacterized membrane protein YhaH (DUF805 family)
MFNQLACFRPGICKKRAARRQSVCCLTKNNNETQWKELDMNETANSAVGAGMSAAAILIALLFGLAIYVFFCFCAKRICEKCDVTPGVLIWIPIVQLVPMLQAAKMSVWMIILFLIPLVNLIVWVIMWVKICQALGKSGWLVILLFIPIANLIFIPYLAFSE